MERKEVFPALNISSLRIRLVGAPLTVTVDEVDDIQVIVSGEHPDSMKLLRQESHLIIAQSLHPMRRISSVTVLLPMDWKGSLDARSLTGNLEVSGFAGTDLTLCSLSGGVFGESLACITSRMHTLSGAIGVSELSCELTRMRTLCGQVVLNGGSFMIGKLSALFSRPEMELTVPFELLSIRCLFGSMTVYAPIVQADATLTSLRGRVLTDGISIAQGASHLRMCSVTANLHLICSLDTQAMI